VLIAAGQVLGSIPSPSFNVFHIGPLTLRMYGLFIALGAVAGVSITSKRWQRRGGNPDDVGNIAIWAVPAGVIGARMYHVATDWNRLYSNGRWAEAFNITRGGLGIPGGVLAGVLVGLLVAHRKKLPALILMDMVAPALPVAQAIGRLGNWFNQELFGRPTSLPWGLRIDAQHAATAGYAAAGTFQPTFLYEALWNLALAVLLIRIDRMRKLRPGELFTLYVFGYSVGRLWVEELRSDPATHLLGIRVNVWMSVIVGLVAIVVFVRNRRHPAAVAEEMQDPPDVPPSVEPTDPDAPGENREPRPETGDAEGAVDRPPGQDADADADIRPS
jgi:prolipoprotein diacylglyceryl transferase